MASRAASPRHAHVVAGSSEGGAPSTAAAAAPASGDAVSADAAASATAKQTRASLSIHEKTIVKSFCEQRVDESKARGEVVPSQDLLRREVHAKFGWEMGRSTLSKIMTVDWKALTAGAHRNPNMKRKRKPLFPDFEADLVKYIGAHIAHSEARAAVVAAVSAADLAIAASGIGSSNNSAMMQACGVGNAEKPELMASSSSSSKFAALQGKRSFVLTEAVILEEAQRLKQVHGIKDEELVLSVGWLARFKHRNGIRLRKGASGKQQQQVSSSSPSAAAQPGFVNASLVSTSELLFGGVESKFSTAEATAAPSPSLLETVRVAGPLEVDTAFAAESGGGVRGGEAQVAGIKGEDATRSSFFKAAKFAHNTARRRRASL